MLITRRWLARFINVTPYSDQQVAAQLTRLGFATKLHRQVFNHGLQLATIRRAQLVPATQRLWCYTVEPVGQTTVVPVVCSDGTLQTGQWVIYAPPGARLNSGAKIQTRLIRGHRSVGMLCSLAELGVGDSQQTRVWRLAQQPLLSPGPAPLSFADRAGVNDTVFEVELTINRADCLGVLFLVRELAAAWRLSWRFPGYTALAAQRQSTVARRYGLRLAVQNNTAVWLWQLLMLDWSPPTRLAMADLMLLRHVNAPVAPHPLSIWQCRLMLETGYALIGLDPRNIHHQLVLSDQAVIGKRGERGWALLDGTTIKQVIGQAPTQFTPPTGSQWMLVVLILDPQVMRQQQKVSGQQGLWFDRLIRPRSLAGVGLITCYLPAVAPHPTVSWYTWQQPYQQQHHPISISGRWLHQLLAVRVTARQLQRLLAPRGFRVQIAARQQWIVTAPAARIDVTDRSQVAAELLRLTGYQRLSAQPCRFARSLVPLTGDWPQQQLVNQLLCHHQFTPVFGHYLVSKAIALRFNWARYQPLMLQNPLAHTHVYWQTSLLPQLLVASNYNHARGIQQLQLFCTGNIPDGKWPTALNYRVALLVSGARTRLSASLATPHQPNFGTMKWWWQRIGRSLNLDVRGCEWRRWRTPAAPAWAEQTFFHPHQTFVIYYRQHPLAWTGCLTTFHPHQTQITLHNTYFLELNLTHMLRLLPVVVLQIHPAPETVLVTRDLTYSYDGTPQTAFRCVANLIERCCRPVAVRVWPVDTYPCAGSATAPRFNVTVRMQFAPLERTKFNNRQVDELIHRLKAELLSHQVRVTS